MWASGTTTDGSSSVPARTNITSGRVYSLNTATWRETALRTYGRGVPPLYAVPYERRIAAIRDAVANFLADAGTPVATGCA
jgi:hypothetical protein